MNAIPKNSRQLLRSHIINSLKDGKTHTINEMTLSAHSSGLLPNTDSTPIRSLIHQMKKEDTNIISIKRGEYQYHTSNTDLKTQSEPLSHEKPAPTLDEITEHLKSILDHVYQCNWIALEPDEFKSMQETLEKLRKIKELFISYNIR